MDENMNIKFLLMESRSKDTKNLMHSNFYNFRWKLKRMRNYPQDPLMINFVINNLKTLHLTLVLNNVTVKPIPILSQNFPGKIRSVTQPQQVS